MRTLVDNNHKTLNDFGEEIVHNDDILIFVKDIKVKFKEDKYKNDSVKDIKKDYPDEMKEFEEALLKYMGENDLELLKTEFSEKGKLLTKKLAYPYEYFNSSEDYQKPVDNLKKEDFFLELEIDYPSDEEIERTKGNYQIIQC